jgi:hypothetical protein
VTDWKMATEKGKSALRGIATRAKSPYGNKNIPVKSEKILVKK